MSVFTVLGAGSQQVDDVEMRTQVAHDLQLRHEGLSLAPPGCGCRDRERVGGEGEGGCVRTEGLNTPGSGHAASLPNCSMSHLLKRERGWQLN